MKVGMYVRFPGAEGQNRSTEGCSKLKKSVEFRKDWSQH